MTATHEDPAGVHDRVWDDLSWYVNGTLDERSATRVEAHVLTCAACREELVGQQVVKRTAASHSSLEYAPQASFLKLLGRIEAHERRRQRWRRLAPWMGPRAPGRSAAPSSGERPRPTALLVALSVQAAAILLLLGWSGWLLLRPPAPGAYVTLTAPGTSAGSSGAALRVVFADATPVGEMHSILRAIDARIVDGPNGSGALTIEVASAGDPSARRSAALKWLRARRSVAFAEPVDAPGVETES